MPPSVLIVDPEPFFSEALSHALSGSDLEVVGVTSDEHQATELVERRTPDIVLTELLLRNGSGLNLAKRVAGASATVLLTRRSEGEGLLDAIAAGADGCLSHSVSLERLRSLLPTVRPGRFIVDADRLRPALEHVAASVDADPRRAGSDALTLREREILRLVASGLGDREIASALYISPNTVRTHVARILKKFGAHSRAEATRAYLKSQQEERSSRVLHIQGPDLGRA